MRGQCVRVVSPHSRCSPCSPHYSPQCLPPPPPAHLACAKPTRTTTPAGSTAQNTNGLAWTASATPPPARPRSPMSTFAHARSTHAPAQRNLGRVVTTGRHRVRALRRRKARCAGRKTSPTSAGARPDRSTDAPAQRHPAHPRTARPTLPHNGIWPCRDESAHRRVGVLRRPSPTRRSTRSRTTESWPRRHESGHGRVRSIGACVPFLACV